MSKPTASPAETGATSPAAPKPAAQTMIETAVAALLPHAAYNVMLPFETPLRWHESYTQGDSYPHHFSLWANLTPDRRTQASITRTLPTDPDRRDRLWACTVTEPAPADTQDFTYSHTTVSVSIHGIVEVSKVLYKKDPDARPDYQGYVTGAEYNSSLTTERKAELLGHVGEVLGQAALEIPTAQAEFFKVRNGNLAERAFDLLGSRTSKTALEPILALAA